MLLLSSDMKCSFLVCLCSSSLAKPWASAKRERTRSRAMTTRCAPRTCRFLSCPISLRCLRASILLCPTALLFPLLCRDHVLITPEHFILSGSKSNLVDFGVKCRTKHGVPAAALLASVCSCSAHIHAPLLQLGAWKMQEVRCASLHMFERRLWPFLLAMHLPLLLFLAHHCSCLAGSLVE